MVVVALIYHGEQKDTKRVNLAVVEGGLLDAPFTYQTMLSQCGELEKRNFAHIFLNS